MDFLPNKPVTICIGGVELSSFKSLRLNQSINEHHYFEMLLDYEVGEVFQAATLTKSADWLGKSIAITIGERNFYGLVAQVGLHKSEGYTFLKVSGFSTTYRLEGDLHFASWNEKTLADIVGELAEKSNVQALVKPERSAKLEYECQYQESNFSFIQRLARQHFEWLYYDGEKLIFGKPELPSSITLDSKRDLNSLDICIQTGARALSSFAHLSGSNNTLNSSSPDEPTGLNKLGQHAFQESIKMFGPPANHYATSRVTNKGELDTYLQKKQQSDASMSHFITAESDYVGLMLGSVVDIKSTVQVAGVSYKEELLGAYLITEIVHLAEGDGGYSCQFTAIPASVKSLPTPDVPLPIAQPQMATVISNDDPKKQGRVQVRMNWQINGMKTSWVRVLSPDAGGSEKVSSNRGFVFIPEVGDQVMVAFRYNDPNRPYIQGSLFNGTNGGGGGADNNVKSLTTRSGVAVTLDDSKGSVLIKDKAGNSYAADGAGNIKIESSQTITFTCKDSSITLKEDGNILLDGKILTLNGKDSISLNSKAIDSTAAETNTMNGNDVTVQGNVTATLSGTSKTDVDSMGITSVSGTLVKLN